MSRIHALDILVVNQIAAGEVIERPASVVKELIENSVDALATRVEIDLREGGSELIRVVDDGEGIDRDDLELAVTSHATSKIRAADDLFCVRTMGFRGEALASIAAVSRLRLRSRRAARDEACEIAVEGGQTGPVRPCGSPPGTLVEVRNLFFNTPVRRKFLRSVPTELGHVSEHFTRIALANPRLAIVLRHNDRMVYELPATDHVRDRLRLFFGSQLADKLIWVESQTSEARLWGYVGHPSESRSTRKGQYLFLNGRCIQDRSLSHALGEAYRGLLMTGRCPVAFLFLELAPELVDVNVHPTKSEVRFRDSQPLYRQLLSTLRNRFLTADLESTVSLPDPRRTDALRIDPARQMTAQLELAAWAKDRLAHWTPGAPIRTGSDSSRDDDLTEEAESDSMPLGLVSSSANHAGGPEFSRADDSSAPAADSPVSDDGGRESAGGVDISGPGPSARQVMQVHDCYLIVETEDGITVIDQHALHERVMYEQLRRRVADGAVESQRTLVPQPLELSAREAAALLENADLLEQLGYAVEEFGGATVLLAAYPAMLARADHGRILRDLAESLATAGQKPSRRDILDGLMHLMACKAAVKAGQRLKPEEMDSLLAQRHLIDDAHHCPHGRPAALVLTRTELDRQFGRLG